MDGMLCSHEEFHFFEIPWHFTKMSDGEDPRK